MKMLGANLILTAVLAMLVGCGTNSKSNSDSAAKDSPVYYDYTCSAGYYWGGVNRDSSYAKLSLNWGSVHDDATLYKIKGRNNYDGYGLNFPRRIPRHFQVAFDAYYSNVDIYFEENGYWVHKAKLYCTSL